MKMRSHILSAVAMSCVLKTTVVAAAAHLEHRVLERLGVDRVEARRTARRGSAATAARRPRRRTGPSATCPSRASRSCWSAQPAMPRRAIHSSITRIELGDGAALEPAVVAEQAADRHLLVEAALFGQVADAVARGGGVGGAEHLDLPCVGQQDVHDHPERRRLAGAVGADEAVDRSGGHGERQVVDGGDAVERLVTSVRRMASVIVRERHSIVCAERADQPRATVQRRRRSSGD